MNVDIIGTHRHIASARGSGRFAGSRLLVGLALAAVVLGGAEVAGAHGDAGELTVTRAEQSGPDRIELEVGIVHSDDNHIASGATVTATLVGPAGDTVGPVPLEQVDPDSTLYATEVQVSGPGSWAVAIDSTNPDAGTQTEVDVIQSADDATTTTGAPATTEAPATTDGTASAAEEPLDAAAAVEDSSNNDSRWLLIGAAVAAVALVAIVTVALRRNSGDEPDDDALA